MPDLVAKQTDGDIGGEGCATEVARNAVRILASELLGAVTRGIRGLAGRRLMLVQVMAKVADLTAWLVTAIPSRSSPDELERQHREQEDHEGSTHEMILAAGQCRRLPLLAAATAATLSPFLTPGPLLRTILPEEVDAQDQREDDHGQRTQEDEVSEPVV
ncbi:MAG: hypothetical protein EKK53_04195 [Burkholderiales bacterium]|nr:MAG: hypothetical protein EKK53_04195 [Burkholderiales bacterium]